jgi:hypothetical protein
LKSRLALLAEISRLMALAVDYRVGLAQTGSLVIAEFADAFAVDSVTDDDPTPVRIFTAGVPVGNEAPLACTCGVIAPARAKSDSS